MCCIPLALEFCHSHWSVNLVLAGCSCWSSGGGACCCSSQMSLPEAELPHPSGSRLSNLLGFALGSFCSLQAFPLALEAESENGGLPISAMGPQRKAVTHSPLPDIWPHSVLTRPVTKHFCLWHPTPCGVSKPSRSLGALPRRSPWGRKGSLPGSAACWVPASRRWSLFCSESCCCSSLRSPFEFVGVQNGLIPI